MISLVLYTDGEDRNTHENGKKILKENKIENKRRCKGNKVFEVCNNIYDEVRNLYVWAE